MCVYSQNIGLRWRIHNHVIQNKSVSPWTLMPFVFSKLTSSTNGLEYSWLHFGFVVPQYIPITKTSWSSVAPTIGQNSFKLDFNNSSLSMFTNNFMTVSFLNNFFFEKFKTWATLKYTSLHGITSIRVYGIMFDFSERPSIRRLCKVTEWAFRAHSIMAHCASSMVFFWAKIRAQNYICRFEVDLMK